jgi:hypothetical protein
LAAVAGDFADCDWVCGSGFKSRWFHFSLCED